MSPTAAATSDITREQLCILEQRPQNCGVVIFGASGDLAHRKLLPSLFYLFEQKSLPKSFYVLGVARTEMSDEEFRKKIRAELPKSAQQGLVDQFVERCHYLSGDYSDSPFYKKINQSLTDLGKKYAVGPCHLFYLATPPSLYSPIINHLGRANLAYEQHDDPAGWVRVIIEKPFGHSLASALELNRDIHGILSERQIYRIDHYLAKETVQNILMFRFANILFEPVWNRNYIDYVQITAAEKIGIEHRAGYYEQAGVLRDMFQNHLLQLMALIAMEPPTNLNANSVRNKRNDVLLSMKPMSEAEVKQNTVCAQYTAGQIDGESVAGYKQEKGVSPASRTATFAAVKFEMDNWRWEGVPFYVRAGKRLAERLVDISIHFKQVPTSIFKPLLADHLAPNMLTFRIQPDEGICIRFEAKHPGPKLCMSTVSMDFNYQEAFNVAPPESYARLFMDAILGDQTLFARSDSVEESWRLIDPILNYWEKGSVLPLPTYPAGSWGPEESNALLPKERI